jgi:isopenicillin-N N-acyltransferase-like protein
MTRATSVSVVEVSGSWQTMGNSLGRECAGVAESMVREAKIDFARQGISWDKAIGNSKPYLPYARRYDQTYVDFIKGYGRGSGLSPESLFTLICRGERNLCTDIAANGEATQDGSVLSAHTEDWLPTDQKHVVLVRGQAGRGPAFLAMTLAGLELVTGLNSAGLSFSGNSLYQNDMRVGVPKMFIARKLLAARKMADAIAAATPSNRASSYNNNICHSSGRICCVEGSATDYARLYPKKGYIVHTNHYLSPKMRRFEVRPPGTPVVEGSTSRSRYTRAQALVRKNLGRITVKTMVDILSDHENFPGSICCHEDPRFPRYERDKTLYAVVSDLTRLDMHACLGNPCEGRWRTYSLC